MFLFKCLFTKKNVDVDIIVPERSSTQSILELTENSTHILKMKMIKLEEQYPNLSDDFIILKNDIINLFDNLKTNIKNEIDTICITKESYNNLLIKNKELESELLKLKNNYMLLVTGTQSNN